MSARKPASKKTAVAGVERVLAAMRADLVEHCGGPDRVSVTQKLLIERAAWTALHLRLLDERVAGGAPLTGPDRTAYLALSNALVQAIGALGEPASGDKPLDFENLSDEDLARIIATERAARMSAKRVERIVVDTTARQIITSKINRIFHRETVPEGAPVEEGAPVPVAAAVAADVPNGVAADPLPAPADAPADALDEPPAAPAPPPSPNRPALRVVVSHPSPDGEYPQEYLDHAQKDAQERAEFKRRHHQVL
jgi:hypothetical protein